jgi:hypothetical protein
MPLKQSRQEAMERAQKASAANVARVQRQLVTDSRIRGEFLRDAERGKATPLVCRKYIDDLQRER